MTHRYPLTSRALAAFTLTLALSTGCDDAAEPDSGVRSGLLFDLDDADLERIHGMYLADEDLADTRARLTAPFDCSLYGSFCDQVGAEAAEEITARQVELALGGAPIAEIEAETRAMIAAAAESYSPGEGDEPTFRGSGSWATHTIGDFRMRVRNGITSPAFGDRKAWTEAEVQHRDGWGIWSKKDATEICVNAGTNTQTAHGYGGGGADSFNVLESFNPSMVCLPDVSSLEITTYHNRNNGYENSGLGMEYIIEANGSATAEINSSNFSRVASEHTDRF